MMNYRANEIVIIDGLEEFLSSDIKQCKVIAQSQIAEIPTYPYVSYNVTTPLFEIKGTYSEAEDGTLYRTILQTWSFTVQSNDQLESLAIGMKIADYFNVVGLTKLADKNITVRRVTNLTTRDNLLTVQYEYRVGLDVTFGMLYEITPEAQKANGVIETIEFKEV